MGRFGYFRPTLESLSESNVIEDPTKQERKVQMLAQTFDTDMKELGKCGKGFKSGKNDCRSKLKF